MAIINTREIKGLGDTEVYSMVNAVHLDKSADTVTIEIRSFKDEATRRADIKDFLAVEHIRCEESFADFSGSIDSIAEAYEKAKAEDERLAEGTTV